VASHNLFYAYSTFMLQISEQHIHGCQILDFLHREVTCSVNNVQESLIWLVFHVNIGDECANQIFHCLFVHMQNILLWLTAFS
jgi:hypothetical protein